MRCRSAGSRDRSFHRRQQERWKLAAAAADVVGAAAALEVGLVLDFFEELHAAASRTDAAITALIRSPLVTLTFSPLMCSNRAQVGGGAGRSVVLLWSEKRRSRDPDRRWGSEKWAASRYRDRERCQHTGRSGASCDPQLWFWRSRCSLAVLPNVVRFCRQPVDIHCLGIYSGCGTRL